MDLIFGREKASISIFDIEYEEGSEQHQIKMRSISFFRTFHMK